ncbi:MAG: response regulator [Rubrimonas sp.]|uniref:response regulator n=1 Tax=Rubrimonas sp. TaxID=2036015 RepID=UPI002FDCF5C7
MAAHRPARVALIDDNPDDLLLARLFLRRAGIALPFDSWPTGARFLDAMARNPDLAPDLALVDLNLPVLSGAELLARARAERWARATTFAVCTGSTDPADRAAALDAGAAAFLSKPLTEASLAALCVAAPRFTLRAGADGLRLLTLGARG